MFLLKKFNRPVPQHGDVRSDPYSRTETGGFISYSPLSIRSLSITFLYLYRSLVHLNRNSRSTSTHPVFPSPQPLTTLISVESRSSGFRNFLLESSNLRGRPCSPEPSLSVLYRGCQIYSVLSVSSLLKIPVNCLC